MSQIGMKNSRFAKTINWTKIRIRITVAQIKATLIHVQSICAQMWIHSHTSMRKAKIRTPGLAHFALHNLPAWQMWHGNYATYNVEVVISWTPIAVMPRDFGSTPSLVGSGRHSIVAATPNIRSDRVDVADIPRSSSNSLQVRETTFDFPKP